MGAQYWRVTNRRNGPTRIPDPFDKDLDITLHPHCVSVDRAPGQYDALIVLVVDLAQDAVDFDSDGLVVVFEGLDLARLERDDVDFGACLFECPHGGGELCFLKAIGCQNCYADIG